MPRLKAKALKQTLIILYEMPMTHKQLSFGIALSVAACISCLPVSRIGAFIMLGVCIMLLFIRPADR